MIDLTLRNLTTLIRSLHVKLMDNVDNADWIEPTANLAVTNLIERNRETIRSRISSLRSELDDLERALDNGRMLHGGTRLTERAAAIDEAVNTEVGVGKSLVELSSRLVDRPELA